MMKYLLISIFILIASPYSMADVTEDYNQANELYKNGEYNKAEELYQQVLDSGFTSFELFYNLGNTYYKLDRIPSSILYYEKALKLKPSDEDALFNLRLVNLQTVDKIEGKEKLLMNKWWEQMVNLFSADNWAKITIWLIISGFILVCIYLVVNPVVLKKLTFFSGVVIILMGLGSWALATAQNHRMNADNEGIIFTSNVIVKSAPDGGKDLFVIHEGTKVEILQDDIQWIEISLSNGNSGWIKKSDLIVI